VRARVRQRPGNGSTLPPPDSDPVLYERLGCDADAVLTRTTSPASQYAGQTLTGTAAVPWWRTSLTEMTERNDQGPDRF